MSTSLFFFSVWVCEERDYKGLHAFPSNITRDGPPITRGLPCLPSNITRAVTHLLVAVPVQDHLAVLALEVAVRHLVPRRAALDAVEAGVDVVVGVAAHRDGHGQVGDGDLALRVVALPAAVHLAEIAGRGHSVVHAGARGCSASLHEADAAIQNLELEEPGFVPARNVEAGRELGQR